MLALKIVFGMAPIFLFSMLSPTLGVGGAAGLGLIAAVIVVAANARSGVQELPVAQGILMLLMTILGFTGGAGTDDVLVHYGPALVSLTLGVFLIVTARSNPFTAQTARATVPPALWHNPHFLAVNTRISAAWGIAICVGGVCHIVAEQIGPDGMQLALQIGLNLVVPLVALLTAAAYTKRTAAAAKRRAQEKHLMDDPDAHAAGGAHEAGQVRA